MDSKFHSTGKMEPILPTRCATKFLAGFGIAALLAILASSATAAGLSEIPQAETALAGKTLVGAVRHIYVRLADNVLLDATQVPNTEIPPDTVRYAGIEVPTHAPSATRAVLARMIDLPQIQPGDIVEVRIAHQDNPNFFPVHEVTKVTELVAKSGSALARSFEHGIAPASPTAALAQISTKDK